MKSTILPLYAVTLFLAASVLSAPTESPATTTASTAATAPSELSQRIDQLVKDISNEAFAIRDQAQKDLEALPIEAYPLLKTALEKCTDDEARTRLFSALAKFEIKLAILPTQVTVNLKEEVGSKAVAALAPSLFMYVQGGGKAVPPVTFKADRMPLLRAIAELSKEMPMTLTGQRTSGFAFHIGDPGVFQVSPDGLLLVYGGAIIRTIPLVDGSAPDAAERWQLSLKIAVDPKLNLYARFPHITIDKAEDEDGHAFTAASTQTDGIDGGPRSGVEARLTLTPPEKPGKKIAVLKGHATFYAIIGSETFGVLAKKNFTFDLHGRKLTGVWAPEDDVLHLEISGLLPTGLDDPNFSPQDGGPSELIYATAAGKELSRNTDPMTAYTKDRWIRNFTVAEKTLPELVQFKVISRVQSITVPFEFKNIPVP